MSQILKNKFAIVITLIFLGVLSSFSLPPYNYFFINFFTFPFLFYILVFNLNNNLINNFLTGWFYGFGYFCSNLYWISNSLKFDENFENLVVFSIIFIPFLLSLLYGIFSFLLKFLNLKMNFSSILIFSLLLSIIEYLRGNIFGGFPWNLISFSMVNLTSSLQILNLIGTYSFNLIVITIYCLPIIIIFKFIRNKKTRRFLFLLSISILPIFLIFITSVITGSKIRTMWMTPFYLPLGIFSVYLFRSQINLKKINSFLVGFLFLFFLSPSLYAYISITKTDKRTDYPGKEIAAKVQFTWEQDFEKEIEFVTGDEWKAGNLSYHLKSRPRWEGFTKKEILNKSSQFICLDDICLGRY